MRLFVALACLASIVACSRGSDPSGPAPLDAATLDRNAGLEALEQVVSDEVRIWEIGGLNLRGRGWVLRHGRIDFYRHANGWEPFAERETRPFPGAMALARRLASISTTPPSALSCSNMLDGDEVHVAGRVDGRVFRFVSFNPRACNEPAPGQLAAALSALAIETQTRSVRGEP